MKNSRTIRGIAATAIVMFAITAAVAAEVAPALTGFPGVTRPSRGAASGELSLAPCRYHLEADGKTYDADCGALVVPENRGQEGSRLITLPIVRIRALRDAPAEPIFWFQGGPGSSNVMSYPTDGLLQRHDFVMVGYRGLDSDIKLSCPEILEQIASAKGPALGESARAASAKGAAACAARLTREGVDLAGYSMVETVDDMEAARTALGYERINIFGNSYGTRPQQIYMWRHPQSLHRAVLVAVNPPGHFIWDPYVTDEQLGRYGELCARDEYCRSRTADLVGTLRQVSRNMPRSWMGVPIDADMVKLFSFFMLMETIAAYDSPLPVSGPIAIDMWLDAAEGDASGMALVSVFGKMFMSKMRAPAQWGHFLAMGSSTLDYYDPRRDYENELMPADSILGAPGSMQSWAFTQGWPGNPARHEYNEIPPSDVETLLVSGTLDFSTPGQFSRDELAPLLANGHQVTLEEFGHTETFWYSQDAARAKLLNRFFDEGAVDTMQYVYQPIVFDVERGLDTFVHRLLTMVILVLGVLVALAWVLVRFVRRRRRTMRVGELASAAQGGEGRAPGGVQ